MRGNSPNQLQGNLFFPTLKDQLNPEHPLYLLADEIDWSGLEAHFSRLYSQNGRPAHPIRLMIGLLILKQLDDLGDETVVQKWVENPYYQYFCGMDVLQWHIPIAPSDLVHFRNRIGEEGVEKIFQASVLIHGSEAQEHEVCIDTTVEDKAITYPTDAKLHKRIIEYCWRIAKEENIKLRQSFSRTIKGLMRSQYNFDHPKRRKKARRDLRKIKTITGRLVRDVVRKLPEHSLPDYAHLLALFHKVMHQERKTKNKIYSIHEPTVACINKGKAHPKYEFGAKVSIAQTKTSGIIVAAQSFLGNPHDSKTLVDTFVQYFRVNDRLPKAGIVDRGYQGARKVLGVEIIRPDKGKANKSNYQQTKARKRMRRRAAIEPTIGHLKSRFRLKRNWLKGQIGDQINLLLAAAAFNFKKWMNKRLDWASLCLILTVVRIARVKLSHKANSTTHMPQISAA